MFHSFWLFLRLMNYECAETSCEKKNNKYVFRPNDQLNKNLTLINIVGYTIIFITLYQEIITSKSIINHT